MINLLPESQLGQLRAAQHNTMLVRYVVMGLITLVIVVAIHVLTYTLLKSAEDAGNKEADANRAKIAEYEEVRETAKKYKANLETAKALMGQNISYTTALFNIASYIPQGVILQSLDLSPDSIGKTTTLSARAKSYDDGIALKDSLIKSNIAKDASLVSLIDERTVDGTLDDLRREYPFSVSVSVVFTEKLIEPTGETNQKTKKEQS